MRWALFVALMAGQEDLLHPQDPIVERRAGGWRLKLRVKGSLPDGAVVQIRIYPQLYVYREEARVIERTIPETLPPGRRAQFKSGNAEVHTELIVLRTVTIRYRIDPDEGGAAVECVRRDVALGSLSARGRAMQEDHDRPLSIHRDLMKALDKLEGALKAQDVARAAAAVVGPLNEVRAKCAKEGPCTAALGLLDTVASDAITYASWLASRRAAEKASSGGEDPAVLDDPEGGGGPAPEPGDGVNRGSGDITAVTVDLLRKRASMAPAVHRAESTMFLLHETELLLRGAVEGRAADASDLKALAEGADFLEKKLAEEFPKGTGGVLRSAMVAMKGERTAEMAAHLEAVARCLQAAARL